GSDAPKVTAGSNSVAIGANSTDGGRSNVVSVGSPGAERQITNVAPGTQGTDAVNLNQLNSSVNSGIRTANSYTDQRINTVNQAINDVARNAYSGIAMSMAMSGTYLPSLNPGEKTLGVGLGGYQGYGAVAINFKGLSESGKLSYGVGVSTSGHAVGFNAGMGMKW
ncbi:YadA family autotransporter adhesin, partial [Burkholderia territorii]|uniref:YadA family autotransporter adhesin n=1 Tax=Burkholderia territorii TaxID=1503055 RepID=UPI000A85018B